MSVHPNEQDIVDHCSKLESDLAAARGKIERLREALRRLEWRTTSGFDMQCSGCRNLRPYAYDKSRNYHEADCWLAAMLEEK